MYQELSAKIDEVAYNTMVNLTMDLFPSCNASSAWDPNNTEEYQNCTKQISSSHSKIQENFENIELFLFG